MAKKLLNASNYDTDKAEHAYYFRNYEKYFEPLLDQEAKLLELGGLFGQVFIIKSAMANQKPGAGIKND